MSLNQRTSSSLTSFDEVNFGESTCDSTCDSACDFLNTSIDLIENPLFSESIPEISEDHFQLGISLLKLKRSPGKIFSPSKRLDRTVKLPA